MALLLVFLTFGGISAHIPTVWVPKQATHLCVDCLVSGTQEKIAHETQLDNCGTQQLKPCTCQHTTKITSSINTLTRSQSVTHSVLYDNDTALECINTTAQSMHLGGRFLRQAMPNWVKYSTNSLLPITINFLQLQRRGKFSASTRFSMLRNDELIVIAPRA